MSDPRRKIWDKKYRETHKEQIKAKNYPENRNPDVRKASNRAYRERNRERINARQREKRGNAADWWKAVCERIEKIAQRSKV